MKEYDRLMTDTVCQLKEDGYTDCGFGDIFLEDLRTYREEQLAPLGIRSHFPLWKRDTTELVHEFERLGFKAVIICLKADLLDASFLGREVNAELLRDLPEDVDPCGENGEFHTFCYAGPIFSQPIAFEVGERVFRSYQAPKNEDTPSGDMGFWFLDLLSG